MKAPCSGADTRPKKQPRKRITLVLHVELIDRLLDKAQTLQQNPNNFVNRCVEGALDAMDHPEAGYNIPVLALYNEVKGGTFLTNKAVMTLLGALAPEIHEIDAQERQFLMELLGRHEGNLTMEVLNGYRKLAHRMNTERAAHERELKKLQSKRSNSCPRPGAGDLENSAIVTA
jgi:hypothetical protein